jgi:hypothetical protein
MKMDRMVTRIGVAGLALGITLLAGPTPLEAQRATGVSRVGRSSARSASNSSRRRFPTPRG